MRAGPDYLLAGLGTPTPQIECQRSSNSWIWWPLARLGTGDWQKRINQKSYAYWDTRVFTHSAYNTLKLLRWKITLLCSPKSFLPHLKNPVKSIETKKQLTGNHFSAMAVWIFSRACIITTPWPFGSLEAHTPLNSTSTMAHTLCTGEKTDNDVCII